MRTLQSRGTWALVGTPPLPGQQGPLQDQSESRPRPCPQRAWPSRVGQTLSCCARGGIEEAGGPERILWRARGREGSWKNESRDPGAASAPSVSHASPGDSGRGRLQLNGKGAGEQGSGSLCPQGSSASSRLHLRQTDATPSPGPGGSLWDRDRVPRSRRPASRGEPSPRLRGHRMGARGAVPPRARTTGARAS